MGYSDITVDDRNPIKRFMQRRRLRETLSVLDGLGEHFAGRVLDFGGGSGELTRTIAEHFPSAELFCYEPAPEILAEARQNLGGIGNATLVSSLKDLRGSRFEYVFCVEVFEHLPHRQTVEAMKAMERLLIDGGTIIVGVPNELFVSALLKSLFRMTRRYGAYDARPGNVLQAFIGGPPGDRLVEEISPGLPYHFHHTGFDHRKLQTLLSGTFDVTGRFGSPVRQIELLSSEISLINVMNTTVRADNALMFGSGSEFARHRRH